MKASLDTENAIEVAFSLDEMWNVNTYEMKYWPQVRELLDNIPVWKALRMRTYLCNIELSKAKHAG